MYGGSEITTHELQCVFIVKPCQSWVSFHSLLCLSYAGPQSKEKIECPANTIQQSCNFIYRGMVMMRISALVMTLMLAYVQPL